MRVITLARVSRSAAARREDPSGLALQKISGCTCGDLVKGRKKRRKLRGSTKTYLSWLARETTAFSPSVHVFLQREAKRVARLLSGVTVEKGRKPRLKAVDELSFKGWDVLYGVLQPKLYDSFVDQAKQGLVIIGVEADESMTSQLDVRALAYSKERAADLVGMKEDRNGNLVDNPDSEIAITDSTREELRALVSDAVEEGWSSKDLEQEILDTYAFSESRAETIARTELAFSHSAGNMAGWEESGVVEQKQWVLGSEHDMDDECNDNMEAGAIALDEDFPSGDPYAPAHPNCVCDVIPIVAAETPEGETA